MTKSMVYRVKLLGFKPRLCHFPAEGLWVSYFNSLCLIFLICNMKVIITRQEQSELDTEPHLSLPSARAFLGASPTHLCPTLLTDSKTTKP